MAKERERERERGRVRVCTCFIGSRRVDSLRAYLQLYSQKSSLAHAIQSTASFSFQFFLSSFLDIYIPLVRWLVVRFNFSY